MLECKNAKDYKAMYAPRCNNGKGCEACRAKWQTKQRAAARRKARMAK